MKGTYKRFDKKLFEENDKIARDLSKKVIEQLYQLRCLENPDKYDVDLWMIREDRVIAYAECEIKKVWLGVGFPWSSVQFPERKAKYARLDKPTLFCMINNMKNRAALVWSKDLLTSPLVEVSNKYNSEGELFYQVPLSKVLFHDIK